MAVDLFQPNLVVQTSPARGSIVITPNDGTDLSFAVRQVTIGTAGGTITWRDVTGQTWATGPLPVGTYPMSAHRVLATGTTATGLTGWL